MIENSSKPCPFCQTPISHYYKHGCHHIKPGAGCPGCRNHFCYICLGPHPCQNGCPLFCNETCGCPTCPECTPGNSCDNCDGPSSGCPGCKT